MRSPDPAAPYTLILPRTFQPADCLPLRLLSTIVRKTAHKDVDFDA